MSIGNLQDIQSGLEKLERILCSCLSPNRKGGNKDKILMPLSGELVKIVLSKLAVASVSAFSEAYLQEICVSFR